MPDSRISQVRFEALAFLPRAFPAWRGLSAGSHTPQLPWFAHSLVPLQASALRQHCVWPPRCSMDPPSAQSPFAPMLVFPSSGRRVHHLLRGRYASVIAPTDSFANPVWLFLPSAIASCKKSSQVATSPCCHRDFPDVISANLSSDAWSLATAVPRSAYTCFFLRVIGLPPERPGSASRFYPRIRLLAGGVFEAADIPLCSGLRVCSSPRSFLPLHIVLQGSRDFYIRAERASLPLHAPDLLAVRIQAIDGTRTFTSLDSQPCRLLRWDRTRARRLAGGGLPASPFRLRGGFTIPPWPRFPRPPYNAGLPDFPGPV